MPVTDPIADLLTRIRNGQQSGHDVVLCPGSKIKKAVADVLAQEGYVREVSERREGIRSELRIALRYGPDKVGAIREVRRASRPGRRWYVAVDQIPRVKNGLGIAILSTSRGVMVDREARRQRVGGELICTVW